MSEMLRLIWTSEPDAIDLGELTIEMKFRREWATIILRQAAKRDIRPVDLINDIVESALLISELPGTSEFDEQADILMERLWG
jgi:hypothetical protein